MTEADPVLDVIVSGSVDSHLDTIMDAVKLRREQINNSKILFLNIGDTVKFNSQASPKYLRGIEATISKINRTTVNVNISEDTWGARRYRGAKNVRTPIAIIDKV